MNRYLDLKKIDHTSKPALVNESWFTKRENKRIFQSNIIQYFNDY